MGAQKEIIVFFETGNHATKKTIKFVSKRPLWPGVDLLTLPQSWQLTPRQDWTRLQSEAIAPAVKLHHRELILSLLLMVPTPTTPKLKLLDPSLKAVPTEEPSRHFNNTFSKKSLVPYLELITLHLSSFPETNN